MLGHKGNANQNDIEISPLPSQNSNDQEHKQQMLARIKGKRSPYPLLVRM
jgi:hypothetical protein